MKKFLSLLIIGIMLFSVTAYGADYAITGQTGFDRLSDQLTVRYTGHAREQMTLFVYDVSGITNATKETLWDVENMPIIGIDQSMGRGIFVVGIDQNFTGNVIIVLGGERGDATKVLLEIVNGVPTEIKDATYYDAKNDKASVGSGKTITIQKDSKLLNAYVSTTGTGAVKYFNEDNSSVTITGNMFFDGEGAIDAVSGSTVKVVSENADNTYNVGFINRANIAPENTKYIVTLNGSDGKSASKEFTLDSLYGEVRIRVGAENIPVGVTVEQTVTVK